MKKIGLIITGMSLFMLLLGTGVWADITLTDTGSGPNLTFETSPNVTMGYGANATADKFFIVSVNEKGTVEYGIDSSYSGYYMKTVDVGTAVNGTTPEASTFTGTGWTEAGG